MDTDGGSVSKLGKRQGQGERREGAREYKVEEDVVGAGSNRVGSAAVQGKAGCGWYVGGAGGEG